MPKRDCHACPTRNCDQRGWKAEQPAGRWSRGRRPAPTRQSLDPRRAAPSLPPKLLPALLAALAALLAAAATGDAGPVKSVREGLGGVQIWGGCAGKGLSAGSSWMGEGEGSWTRGGVLGRGAGWRRAEVLRRGEEGDRSRQGADGEGGVGLCPGLPGAEKSLGARTGH